MSKCKWCGEDVSLGARFCPKCGKELGETGPDDQRKADHEEGETGRADAETPGEKDDSTPSHARGPQGPKVSSGPQGKKVVAVTCLMVALLVAIPFVFSQSLCSHESWSSATCTEPKRCKKCGKTEGSPRGHKWVDATCDEPKKCERCGETEGEALGHDLANWSQVNDYENSVSEEVRKCKRCDEVVETRNEQSITSYVGDGAFTITPAGLIKRLDNAFSEIPGYSSVEVDYDLGDSGHDLDIVMKKGSKKVGVGVFYSDSSTQLSFSYYSSPNSFKNVLLYLGSDSGITAASTVALIRATDPTLSFDEAKQVASDCAGEVIEHNGITYAVEYADGGYWMSARIE